MPGPVEIVIVLIIVVLLFGGRGKISSIMGDIGKGITSFRKGLKDGDNGDSNDPSEAIDVTPKKDDA